MAAIAPRVPWITIIVLGPSSPEVVIDSTPVPPASLGAKRAINPGSHKITAAAEGFQPNEKVVTMAEGQSLTVHLDLDPVPVDNSAMARKAAAPSVQSETGSSSDLQRTLGYVALGIGGAGIVFGGVTSALALSKFSKLSDNCNGSSCEAPMASDLDAYHLYGAMATAGLIAGGVVEKGPKGTSRRTVAIGPALVEIMNRHRARQEIEQARRALAASDRMPTEL